MKPKVVYQRIPAEFNSYKIPASVRIRGCSTENDNGCWMWDGCVDAKGYGIVRVGGAQRKAHRVSYETFNVPIPDGMLVRHTCDAPGCVNPKHLLVGTSQDNVDDRERRGRGHRGPRGPRRPDQIHRGVDVGTSKLTEDNVVEIRRLLGEGHKQAVIASRYGVTQTLISRIKRGVIWRHVP